MSLVARKRIIETIRQLEIIDLDSTEELKAIETAIGLLKGYMRILIVLSQFRITLVTFFGHYPELFGDFDENS